MFPVSKTTQKSQIDDKFYNWKFHKYEIIFILTSVKKETRPIEI